MSRQLRLADRHNQNLERAVRGFLENVEPAQRKRVVVALKDSVEAVQANAAERVNKLSGDLARFLLSDDAIGSRRGGLVWEFGLRTAGQFRRLRRKKIAAWRMHFLEFGTRHSRAFPFFHPAGMEELPHNRRRIARAAALGVRDEYTAMRRVLARFGNPK